MEALSHQLKLCAVALHIKFFKVNFIGLQNKKTGLQTVNFIAKQTHIKKRVTSHDTHFTNEVQFTLNEECCSDCGNACVTSSVALAGAFFT